MPSAAVAALVAVVVVGVAVRSTRPVRTFEGRAPTPDELRPGVKAAFARQSYVSGETATLHIVEETGVFEVRIFKVGSEDVVTRGDDEFQGVPVSPTLVVHARRTRIGIGHWASGLYFARVAARDGRVGFAPFVVRPRRLGEHQVAVVLPTMTWQAYNLRGGGSWYASWRVRTVRLARPFLNRGVPYNFRSYDLPYLRWLARHGHQVDVLSDADLDRNTGDALARVYRLIVFPGHQEYVTRREYDAIERFRDDGGNLAFLSANNFFWETVRHGDSIERTRQWRDAGRPEASLIGVAYRANDDGTHRGPWIARGVESARWLFAGTGIETGKAFGWGGVEIDHTTAQSPPGVQILAEIPNVLGHGLTAQMTYYETESGAKVFAAGAFAFTAKLNRDPIFDRLATNLWRQLGNDATMAGT
jgi:N,N-dimethylformamidase beta subunit-like, C-terminal